MFNNVKNNIFSRLNAVQLLKHIEMQPSLSIAVIFCCKIILSAIFMSQSAVFATVSFTNSNKVVDWIWTSSKSFRKYRVDIENELGRFQNQKRPKFIKCGLAYNHVIIMTYAFYEHFIQEKVNILEMRQTLKKENHC